MTRMLTTLLAAVLCLAATASAKTTRLTQFLDPNFTNAAHWDNGAPADGDTIGATLFPFSVLLNRPTTGTYSISQVDNCSFATAHFLNGAAILNATASAGSVVLAQAVTGTVTTSVDVAASAAITITGAITVNAGGSFITGGHAVIAAGGIVLAGTGKLNGSGVGSAIDTTTITGTGEIDWGSGDLDIFGAINGTAITHTNVASGNSLTADVTGTLNLGNAGDATTAALAITVNGASTQTLGANLRCGAMTLSTGTLAAGTYTITNAGFTLAGSTFTGSGAMYVNCPDGVDGGAQTPASALTYSSGTNSHTGTWTQGTGNLSWNTFSYSIASYVAGTGSTVTLTDTSVVASFSGSGAVAVVAYTLLLYNFTGTNWWTYSGTMTGTSGRVEIVISYTTGASPSNATGIAIGSTSLQVGRGSTGPVYTFTTPSVKCGSLLIRPQASQSLGTVVTARLSAGAVTLGSNLGANGGLSLSAGTDSVTSLASGSDSTANALTLAAGATLRPTGTITGTGITVTAAAGSKVRKGGPAATLTAVTATGTQLDARGCINGGTNVNVRFGSVPSVVMLAE